jgi:hypothetical protein
MDTESINDNRVDAFNAYRTRMNARILEGEKAHLGIKRLAFSVSRFQSGSRIKSGMTVINWISDHPPSRVQASPG